MTPALLLAAPLIGAVTGSFAATAGLRWARGEQALTGRSRCDACSMPLGFGQTVPIVSYLRAGGACTACRTAISPIHPAGEVAGAGLALASVALLPPAEALLATLLGLVLLGMSVADLRCGRLPDLASAGVATLGAALAFERGATSLLLGGVAAAVTAGLLLVVRRAFSARGRDPGLGLGDVKLGAGLALWLGAATPWFVALAGLLGLLQVRLARPVDRRIAFGPALALAGWIVGLAVQAGFGGDFTP